MTTSGVPQGTPVDFLGRHYLVGPSAEELTGRPRSRTLSHCLAAMAAIGVLQYGFGSLVPALTARGWAATDVFWLLALWTVCQAGAGFPTAFLRERGTIGPRGTMLAGAVLVPLGPLALAHGSPATALVGYSILSGTGAGLVYATCSSTVAKWYPERSAGRVSVITGAFAYGPVPFAVAYLLAPDDGALVTLLTGTAVLSCLLVASGAVLRDPPADWWPPDSDPRAWMVDRNHHAANAVHQYSLAEAARTGVAPLMYLILFLASAVSLFNVTFLATMGTGLDTPTAVLAIGTGLLLGANGAGRALSIRTSEATGRRRTLGWVLTILGTGQLGLASAASTGSTQVLLLATVLAGAGGGAFYPLFASLVRDYFGERSARQTHAAVYSAKAFGGVLGVGGAAVLAPEWGYPTLFLVAGGLALGSALLCHRLRHPGRFLPGLPRQQV